MAKQSKKNYFGKDEELAVVDYLSATTDEERSEIYRTKLAFAIDKLAENIINTYGLHRVGLTYEENHADAVSFIMLQADKFKPAKGKKAYSYYGTICKNYLIAERKKYSTKLVKHQNYDDYSEYLEDSDDLSYYIEDDSVNITNLIKKIVVEIQNTIDEGIVSEVKGIKLNDNEIKLGYALIELFSNYDTILDDESKNNKYDKNSILSTIRNYTNLTTKDIRVSMTKYKVLYNVLKNEEIENGSVD